MDFQSSNLLNVWLNLLSGNLLPMTDKSSFSLFWKVYSAFVWLLDLVYVIAGILFYFSASKDTELSGGFDGIFFIEIIGFLINYSRILTQKTLVQQLIRKLNEALSTEDENMRRIITTNLKLIKNPFIYYVTINTISVIYMFCDSFLLILERNTFYYSDYVTPAVFSKEPFSLDVFLLGNMIMFFGSTSIMLKIISVDIYTVHLISLITAQYQYISLKLVLIFRNNKHLYNSSSREGNSEVDSFTTKEIKSLCPQHVNAIDMTLMLKKLISVNIFFMYLINIFRFCFLGLIIVTTMSESFILGCSIILYSSGSATQFYVLCACFQRLSDATSEITDEAFYEDWNQFNLSIKRIFLMIIMASNNIEIKISLFEQFDLSLPSFMSILNQAYSIAIMILNMS